jgi:hypothetical protein
MIRKFISRYDLDYRRQGIQFLLVISNFIKVTTINTEKLTRIQYVGDYTNRLLEYRLGGVISCTIAEDSFSPTSPVTVEARYVTLSQKIFVKGNAIPVYVTIRKILLRQSLSLSLLSRFRCVIIDGVCIGEWIDHLYTPLGTTITVLSLISTLYKLPQHPLSLFLACCLYQPFPGNGF